MNRLRRGHCSCCFMFPTFSNNTSFGLIKWHSPQLWMVKRPSALYNPSHVDAKLHGGHGGDLMTMSKPVMDMRWYHSGERILSCTKMCSGRNSSVRPWLPLDNTVGNPCDRAYVSAAISSESTASKCLNSYPNSLRRLSD